MSGFAFFPAEEIGGQKDFWKVLRTTDRSQVAVMVLKEGQVSGEFGTDHPESDQILYCVTGAGKVRFEDEERAFAAGDAVLIPAGMNHQVHGGPCVTFNVYAPVAYPEA